jgi:signal transduction histidine kinase/DNA-binding response OmpR family regulator
MKPGLHIRPTDEAPSAAPRAGEAPSRRAVLAPPMAMDLPEEAEARLYSAGLPVAGFLMAIAVIAFLTDASYLVSVPLVAGALTLAGLSLFVPQKAKSRPARAAALRLPAIKAPPLDPWSTPDLIEALGLGRMTRDGEGRILAVSDEMARMLGQEPEMLRGATLKAFGIDLATAPEASFAGKPAISAIDVALPGQPAERWLSWLELSERRPDGAVRHHAVARDITQRRTAEAAREVSRRQAVEASRAKSRFLATVSHEIRTPMNGIMGMAQLLGQTALTPEQSTYVGAVSTSSSALLALIEDLLDYSKIESGRLELDQRPTNVRELSENVVELLAARAHAKGIGLGLHVAADVPERVLLDGGKLRQILLNLVGNAIKFTDRGGVLVKVARRKADGVEMLRVSVRDTGPGLAPADLTRIFMEYEQAGSDAALRQAGAGLGLSISQRIAEAMGGRLTAASKPARGSIFAAQIPVGVLEEAATGAPLSGKRVLIVSRNRMEAEAMALSVRDHGGMAAIARTVEEAAQLAEGGGFTLLVVDAALENDDGTLLRRLRQVCGHDAPAITFVDPKSRGRVGHFRAHGYSHFLPRPLRRDTLLKVLLERIEESKPAKRLTLAQARTALNVLVAEDNEINALLARSALVRAGHRVETVANGRLALEAATMRPGLRFDVILMDLQMPVMDGMEAIAAIRAHEAENGLPGVPILVLSADDRAESRQKILAHGASGFIAKPVDPARLIAILDEAAGT